MKIGAREIQAEFKDLKVGMASACLEEDRKDECGWMEHGVGEDR